jgi:hypothetical protein
MLDDGDAGHLDGAGPAPVAEPGGTRRGPAAQQADREARQEQSPAPVGSSRDLAGLVGNVSLA